MKKYYGIFEVCIDSYQGKDALKNKKTSLYADYLQEMKKDYPSPWSIRAKDVYEGKTGNEIQCVLFNLRQRDAYDEKHCLCHRFRTKYFIHETDELGWLKLSKKEQAEAEALVQKREIAEKEAEAKNSEYVIADASKDVCLTV